MKVHKAGLRTINIATVIIVVFNLLNGYFVDSTPLKLSIFGISITIYLLVVQFFRYPQRNITTNKNLVLSPADGKVCEIKESFENEYLKAACKQVSIFMSPLNVHINWVPVKGKVVYMQHKDGEFYAAFKDKSAEENERTTTAIELSDGRIVVVKQVAGAMARRIINYIEEGQEVSQNDELGFIRFGSRVDLYLPLDTEIKVRIGEKVTGSQTVIAKLSL